MLDYRQLNILTELVQNYYNGESDDKELILLNLEILKTEKILNTVNEYTNK